MTQMQTGGAKQLKRVSWDSKPYIHFTLEFGICLSQILHILMMMEYCAQAQVYNVVNPYFLFHS